MARAEGRYGTVEGRDGRAIVRLERRLAATPEEIWPLLTDPEEVALWLAALEIEPRVGGVFNLTFANTDSTSRGHLTRFEPPTVLEYSWREGATIESLVRFELRATPDAAGTDLLLTHMALDNAASGPEYAAGWHAHLDLLEARLAGRVADWDWLRFNDLLEGYGGADGEQLGKRVG